MKHRCNIETGSNYMGAELTVDNLVNPAEPVKRRKVFVHADLEVGDFAEAAEAYFEPSEAYELGAALMRAALRSWGVKTP